jgi:hypothetical protein
MEKFIPIIMENKVALFNGKYLTPIREDNTLSLTNFVRNAVGFSVLVSDEDIVDYFVHDRGGLWIDGRKWEPSKEDISIQVWQIEYTRKK